MTSSNSHNKKARLYWLDELRGLSVISMFFYHYMWDVVYIYLEDYPWYTGSLGYVWQQSICWSFIIISGFSFWLGAGPVRRGALIFSIGAAITLITSAFTPEVRIWFGILTLIGSCTIIAGILKGVLIKIKPPLGLLISSVLFFLTRDVNEGYIGFEKINLAAVPKSLYANKITAFFGFPPASFYSTDYFSLFPWVFLYLAGVYLFLIYDKYKSKSTGSIRFCPPAGFIGKKALVIYVIHQPAIYVILFVIYRFIL